MRELSVSLSASPSLFNHKLFKSAKIRDVKSAKDVITKMIWSPIVWKNGERKSENFIFSDYCALDFDDGISIDEAVGIFKDYRCIIATTQNHRKIKKDIYADRFRVVVPWVSRIVCRFQYAQNMERLVLQYGADSTCKDAGRLFKPSPGIYFTNDNEKMEVEPLQTVAEYKSSYRAGDVDPVWLQQEIARGSDGHPGRNSAAFRLAAKIFKCGRSDVEVLERLKTSYGICTLPEAELRAVVKSAKKTCGA